MARRPCDRGAAGGAARDQVCHESHENTTFFVADPTPSTDALSRGPTPGYSYWVVPVPLGANFWIRWPYVSAAYTASFESTTMPWTQSNSPGPQPCLPHVARILPSFNWNLWTRSSLWSAIHPTPSVPLREMLT